MRPLARKVYAMRQVFARNIKHKNPTAAGYSQAARNPRNICNLVS